MENVTTVFSWGWLLQPFGHGDPVQQGVVLQWRTALAGDLAPDSNGKSMWNIEKIRNSAQEVTKQTCSE